MLQEGEIRRVGTSSDRKVNVRVISATNVDLEAEVRDGRFRKDLYYRLDVFPIRLPAPRAVRGHPHARRRRPPIGAEHLSDRIRQAGEAPGSSPTLNEAIEQLKCRMIDDALRECGSKTRAAERLGLSRQSLQQMLRRRQA